MSTIKDVAFDAGLGVGTVSRFLNNKPVIPENKRKIEKSIKKLKYKRNEIARGLKLNKTHTIGVLIPDLTDIYATTLVRNIEQTAYERGYNTITCDSWSDVKLEQEKVELLIRRGVDGLVIFPADENAMYIKKMGISVPIVMINSNLHAEKYDSIMIDNRFSGFQTGKWFSENGHLRVGVITQLKYSPGRLRTEGFLKAIEKNGFTFDENLIIDRGFTLEDGYYGMESLMALKEPPSAVFTTNYYTTLGAIKYINNNNIRLPEDLSFIGFDNIGVMDILKPSISVIQQPMKSIGKQAAQLLIKRLSEKSNADEKLEIYLKTRLVLRESTRKNV